MRNAARTRTVAAAVSALLLLPVIPAAAAPGHPAAVAATPTPGAPGIGDPYYPTYGNGGYRVSHYDLRLTYQPKTDELRGTATLLARATQDLSSFSLDFALHVGEVRVNGRPARFTEDVAGHKLRVTPARPLARGGDATVVVRYSGVPSTVVVDGMTSWQRTPDGGIGANEPESAWWWFPSNDHPLDKATFDVSVAVPDGVQAISNGVLTGTSSQAGWTRYTWRESRPQATYLATLAVGRYDITTSTAPNGLPVINAYSKDLGENGPAARASVERTAEVIDWESHEFGPYPFTAEGGYVPAVKAHFSLETQTRPFYSSVFFGKGSNVSVIVHELAHQWFGDDVSLTRWQDIWLNEGFATYAQWLWSEHVGEGTAEQLANYVYSEHPASDPFWKVLPGDPGAAHQFDDAVYDRGAAALQALREAVGDTAFFRILRTWTAVHAYGNATIGQFERLAEKISGRKLDGLFTTWLFTAGRPAAPPAPHTAAAQPRPASWRQIEAAHPEASGS